MMAGGFDEGAAYNRIEVFRKNIMRDKEVQFDLITLAVDEEWPLLFIAGLVILLVRSESFLLMQYGRTPVCG